MSKDVWTGWVLAFFLYLILAVAARADAFRVSIFIGDPPCLQYTEDPVPTCYY